MAQKHHPIQDCEWVSKLLQSCVTLISLLKSLAWPLAKTWDFLTIFCFSFWLTRLPKMKIDCVIFSMMFSVGKARQTRQKLKKIIKNNKKKNYYVICSFIFCNFCQWKRKTKNGMKRSIVWLKTPQPKSFNFVYRWDD